MELEPMTYGLKVVASNAELGDVNASENRTSESRNSAEIDEAQQKAQRLAADHAKSCDPIDRDLAKIIAAWPRLAENIKAAIQLMIESAAR